MALLPVKREEADIAINWACISLCQCPCCVEHFMDGLECDFPDAFPEEDCDATQTQAHSGFGPAWSG